MLSQNRAAGRSRGARAFTFIEIVILVTLVGIVAMLAMPAMFSSLAGARLSAAADEIVAALEFAQLSAVGDGRNYRVTVDAAADTLLMEQMDFGVDLMGAETELMEGAVERESYTVSSHALKPDGLFREDFGAESRYEGVDVFLADFGSTNTVVFNAQGAPSEGGTVTLVCEGQQVVITLDPQSGKVARSK